VIQQHLEAPGQVYIANAKRWGYIDAADVPH